MSANRSATSMQSEREAFRQALEAFEASVEAPLVPGELARQVEAIGETFRQLKPLLLRQIEQVHATDFAEIAVEDPDLLGRVEEMRAEDEAIRDDAERIEKWIASIEPRIEAHEPDEARFETEREKFVEAAVAFVVRVRTQEAAARTWLMEAFNRDRGTGD